MTALVILLCAMPFAGKTSVARTLVADHAFRCISLDDINTERGIRDEGAGLPDEAWQQAHAIAVRRLDELLAGGRPRIVVDDTCCLRFLRDDYRAVEAALDQAS